jgi:NAD(P)H dehydrogenase (quinone)
MMSKTQEKPVARVAIAGATGAVGGALTALMSKDEIELVGLTRDPGKAKFPAGVEAAAVDFGDPATLVVALSGSKSLFLAQGGSPDQVANEIALIDAALKAGVRHVVKLSAFGPASTLYPFNLHPQIEAHLAKQAVAYTVLRPTAFANLLRLIAPHVAAGNWGGAVGAGRNNYIDVRDIAEVARLALLADVEPDTARVYHLSGPRSWSVAELAAELSRLLGKDVRYQARTEQEQKELLLSTGLDAGRAGLLLGLDKLFRDSGISETTLTVEQLMGRAPRPVTDWLNDNIQLFQAK